MKLYEYTFLFLFFVVFLSKSYELYTYVIMKFLTNYWWKCFVWIKGTEVFELCCLVCVQENNPSRWKQKIMDAMAMDFSWDAECYDVHVSAYTAIKNLWSRGLCICLTCVTFGLITKNGNKELNKKGSLPFPPLMLQNK